MATRTWDGTVGSFDSAADWSPTGVPVAGDIAVIDGGAVGIAGATLQSLILRLGASAAAGGPTLNLLDTTLDVATRVQAAANDGIVRIGAFGTVVNFGAISFTG